MKLLRRCLRCWRNFIRSLNRRVRYLGLLVHFITTLVVGFGFFMLLTVFVISITVVEGISMQPALQHGDQILTFRLDRLLHSVVGAEYVPQRGQIIVFKDVNNERLLVKRVVGLPNERVVIKNGTLSIYNTETPGGFIPTTDLPDELSNLPLDDAYDVNVGRGEVFVLGDNRAQSTDSRLSGNVLVNDVTGRLVIRVWPLSRFQFF